MLYVDLINDAYRHVSLSGHHDVEIFEKQDYRIFKTSHCFESYLNYLPDDLRIALSKFRCVNDELPIERGRFGVCVGGGGVLQEMTEYKNFVIQLNWGMNTITYLSVHT